MGCSHLMYFIGGLLLLLPMLSSSMWRTSSDSFFQKWRTWAGRLVSVFDSPVGRFDVFGGGGVQYGRREFGVVTRHDGGGHGCGRVGCGGGRGLDCALYGHGVCIGSSEGLRVELDNIALPKQNFGNFLLFEKNFYVESSSAWAVSEHEAMMFRAIKEIAVEGHLFTKAVWMIEEANFPDYCLEVIAKLGVEPMWILVQ